MGKLKKGKHNHLLTDLLKFAIFSIVMLAPFLAVLSRCMYVTLNKNAYQSYSDEELEEYTLTNELTKLEINKTYFFNSDSYLPNTTSAQINTLTNEKLVLNSGTIEENELYSFRYYYTNSNYLDFYYLDKDDDTYKHIYQSFGNIYQTKFTFTVSYEQSNPVEFNETIYLLELNNKHSLDNVFEYSVNQLNQMQLFNWTTNTAIYTPIEATTQGLGFDPQNNTLAMLLTYWTLNTAIYIIFDIVIYCFTKLTHLTQE